MSTTDRNLEKIMAAAFAQAERSRGDAGMKPRSAKIQRGPDGQRTVGPKRYRLTVWLAPWEYLDMFEEMRHARFTGSVTKWAQSRVTSGRVPQAQTRRQQPRERLRATG